MSIINDKNAQAGGAFFAFKQIGDKLEGTLISKRSTMNAVYGQPQIVYGIKALDGEIWNVGGKAGIDMQMANVKIGQIVGFKFTSIKPATKVGYKDANIVQVYADPNVIDKKWMEENNITELEDSAVIAEAPTTEAPATKSEKLDTMIKNAKETPFNDKDENAQMLQAIQQLAKDKLGVTGLEAVKQKTMEETGLYFSEANYLSIIEKLSDLPIKG